MSLVDKLVGIDVDFNSIPILDLANIHSRDPQHRQELADEVRDACMRVGFFYGDTLQMMKEFFALPLAQKMEIDHKKQANFKGYSSLLSGTMIQKERVIYRRVSSSAGKTLCRVRPMKTRRTKVQWLVRMCGLPDYLPSEKQS